MTHPLLHKSRGVGRDTCQLNRFWKGFVEEHIGVSFEGERREDRLMRFRIDAKNHLFVIEDPVTDFKVAFNVRFLQDITDFHCEYFERNYDYNYNIPKSQQLRLVNPGDHTKFTKNFFYNSLSPCWHLSFLEKNNKTESVVVLLTDNKEEPWKMNIVKYHENQKDNKQSCLILEKHGHNTKVSFAFHIPKLQTIFDDCLKAVEPV